MLSTVVVIGAQWGDEGKGRIVDLLTPSVDAVVRYQGGANAGHTVVLGGVKTILHLVPSGVLHDDCLCIIGNGVVVDPDILIDEIEGLANQGYLKNPKMLAVSKSAHIVLPYHRRIDQLREERLGSAKIGTTGRGIGPAYADKAARIGIRFGDLLDAKLFRKRLEYALTEKNELLKILGGKPYDIDNLCEEAVRWRERLSRYAADTTLLVNKYINEGKKILFEGAQGTLLDIDHGTYPYVTSSSTIAGGVFSGAGVGPNAIKEVLGVIKAYSTRVGDGPFPTEEAGDVAVHFQTRGKEFGSTTGRKRRCGWFDAVALKHSCRINGITHLAITKLDILSGINPIKICVGYNSDGNVIDYLPSLVDELNQVQPIYEEMEGWNEDISNIRAFDKLPSPARAYIKRIAEIACVPAAIISVGYERSAHITLHDIFK